MTAEKLVCIGGPLDGGLNSDVGPRLQVNKPNPMPMHSLKQMRRRDIAAESISHDICTYDKQTLNFGRLVMQVYVFEGMPAEQWGPMLVMGYTRGKR